MTNRFEFCCQLPVQVSVSQTFVHKKDCTWLSSSIKNQQMSLSHLLFEAGWCAQRMWNHGGLNQSAHLYTHLFVSLSASPPVLPQIRLNLGYVTF